MIQTHKEERPACEELDQSRQEPYMRMKKLPAFDSTLGSNLPINDAEKQLVESLANELAYEFCRAAANPDKDFGCDTIAGKMQRILDKSNRKRRRDYQRRARALLDKDFAARRHFFGEFGEANARHRLDTDALGSMRQEWVEAAITERVSAYQNDVNQFAKFTADAGVPYLTKTRLKGVLSKQQQTLDFIQTNINEPQTLTFYWSTEVEGAEIGEWEVYLINTDIVVASGTTDSTGQFTIDFSTFVPPQATSQPLNYFVRIRPRTRSKTIVTPGATPGETAKHTVPSEILGGFSNPVWVTYVKGLDLPEEQFNFQWAFRQLELHLDEIHLKIPQSGSGSDEYLMYGTVHEITGPDDGVIHQFSGFYELGDGKPWKKDLHQHLVFDLGDPNTSSWPKAYVVLVHLIEVDDGGAYTDIINDLWDLAVELLPKLYDDIEKALRKLGIDKWGAAGGAAFLIGLSALIAGSIKTAIIGMVLALLAYVVAMVVLALEDDYFGTQSLVLPLPTNTMEYVETIPGNSVAKTVVDNQNAPYGSYVTDSERLRIYGNAGYPSAGGFDGIVDITLHWRFRNLMDYSLPMP